MSKENQQIIVVERDILFGDEYFEGFRSAEEVDYESRILSNLEIMRRGSTKEPADHPEGNAELDFTYKQPIGYVAVVNPLLKKVFSYLRSSKDEEYEEKRLQGSWSWGFGGHIEPSDTRNGNLIRESVLKWVLRRELEIPERVSDLQILGYLNDDSNEVGKVHFGILYLLNTDAPDAGMRDLEVERVELRTLAGLEELCASPDCNVEHWSRIALEPLRKLL